MTDHQHTRPEPTNPSGIDKIRGRIFPKSRLSYKLFGYEIEMHIPSEADWRSEPWDLDIPYAYEHFFGKDLKESVALFVDSAIGYQEDIMFMPTACFNFYVHAYIDYLMSDISKGDSDGASCFFGIVECRTDDLLHGSPELRARIRTLLQHLGERQGWYGADIGIYGDFKKRAEVCLRMIEEPNQASEVRARKLAEPQG